MLTSPVADQRVIVGAAATLDVVFTDQDGEPAAAPGTVTVGITRGDGTVLVAPGGATSDAGAGRFTTTVAAADNDRLDLLTATWTNGDTIITTLVDVVGRVYFTVAEARAAIDSLEEDAYPTDVVIAARRAVEDEFEGICGCAFVPRYRRCRVDRWTAGRIILPEPLIRTIRSITTDTGVALTTEQLATFKPVEDTRILEATTVPFPCSTALTVEYEHGFDRPPSGIKTVAFTRLRERLNFDAGGIPSRATSFVAESGTAFRIDTADRDSTGNPDVDAELARHDYKPLNVA